MNLFWVMPLLCKDVSIWASKSSGKFGDLPNHIIHFNSLTSTGLTPISVLFISQNRLLEFPEFVGQPVGNQSPFENVLGRRFKAFLSGQIHVLVRPAPAR